ncbi:MAG: patatin family protein [Clostridia bacterium]|nr:patatin family protein [Clostridia bacterium]
MAGLVLEGGAFRGLFTCGVLDALLDEGVHFPYTIGVSSGVSYGISYVSRQRGRNWEVASRFTLDDNYISWRHFFTSRSIMNIPFAFDEIPNKLSPFDYETFRSTTDRFVTVCADATSLRAYYYPKEEHDVSGKLTQASCALPFYFPPVYFKGRKLVDGGLANPIPLNRSEFDGNEANLVILTKPRSYRHYLKPDEMALMTYYRSFSPNAASWLRVRHHYFNHIFERCLKEDGSSKNISLFIEEDRMISRFCRKLDKLKALYDYGYEQVMRRMDEVKDLVRAK